MPLKALTIGRTSDPEKSAPTSCLPSEPDVVHRRNGWNRSQTSRVIPVQDKTVTGENGIHYFLQRHSSLFRIVLARAFHTQIKLGNWYRIDLELVNELGLIIKGEKSQCWMQLACDLLVEQHCGATSDIVLDTELTIDVRAIQADAWETTAESSEVAEFPGFQHSPHGGFEFRVTDPPLELAHLTTLQQPTKTKYFLHISPTLDQRQTIHALPLVVGPLVIRHSDDNGSNQDETERDLMLMNGDTWTTEIKSNDMLRAYALDHHRLPGQKESGVFVVKEGWTLGTPGKIWDSAIVLSDMMVKKVYSRPGCLENRHVIDLSAGTGCVGLLLGYVCDKLEIPNVHITLTDLPEALHMVQCNQQLNFGERQLCPSMSIKKLRWGSASDARDVLENGVADVILVSDVLYDTSHFVDLIQTLKQLSTYGRTVIYLGYKQRGLLPEEEARFFDMVTVEFDITVIEKNTHRNDPVGWEQQHGFLHRDEDGTLDGGNWLGRFALNNTTTLNIETKETTVHVYRLVRKKPLL